MANGLLYSYEYKINDYVTILIPTVQEVWQNEAEYDELVNAIIATPSDYMVQLEDLGLDFASISSFDLFLLLLPEIRNSKVELIFKDLDFNELEIAINPDTGQTALINSEDAVVIDRITHARIGMVLREINHLDNKNRLPANEEARAYMLERARIKLQRARQRARKGKQGSRLEDLIVAMVNTEQFKYGYKEVLSLTIYQFNASVHQIIKKINYDNLMIGCYAGTVNMKEISQDSLNWLSSK